MSMFTKASCTALVACCLTVGTVGAQAALVNFTLTGEVNSRADPGNVFGASVGDDITVTGTFDDSGLSGGTGTVSFKKNTGNTLSFGFAGVLFTADSDSYYDSDEFSSPKLTFDGGVLIGFDFFAQFDTGHEFDSDENYFDGREYGYDATVSGTWRLSDFKTTPVPVPAAVWLLGSGLIGLVGIARRRRGLNAAG